jgi:hypothetical protein
MKFIDELVQSLTPHSNRLNQTIAASAVMLQTKLDKIESAVSDLGSPDVGDRWIRINFKRKLKAKEWVELSLFGETPAEVPMNEIWAIQALISNGVEEKSPNFQIAFDEISLVASVEKEKVGLETFGGRVVGLPGETLFIRAEAEGVVSITLHILRRRNPTVASYRHDAGAIPLLQGRNTHEIPRDLVAASQDSYPEPPREVGTNEIIPGIPMPSMPLGSGGQT